ncbi:nonsense-mediated mRNA decay factor SMG9 isoform X3 [Phacochoerus africanus]|uniref:nonsense-mediated mRNA decay factor SMG9 isoform X3 n=1 Tax=Phacochoerus africanus TaxID=41426 RepID=UPI001FD95ECF|nr:nonsense-mediated mRNA decay factor SMG9 isoform X3 [Phacochoerus africanus]
MSESGHSQPGLYGMERRRRWKEPGPGGPQNLSGPGGRERDYIAPWERERRDGSEEPGTAVMQKTPIILSKPPAERSKQTAPPAAPAAPPAPAPLEKPIVLMKPREEGKGPAASTPASTPEGTAPPPPVAPAPPKGEKEGQRPTQPVYQIQNRGMGTAAPAAMDPVVGQAKLLPPERMKHSIKLVDDQMNWCDSAIEYLLDQTDVLVVGVLGLQGTGKSMVMSLLSANTPEEDQRAYVFRAQSAEMKERGGNQTSGIDFFITQERIVFLDTQPILSPSILDHLINNDRKLPPEYNLPHTYVEMQVRGPSQAGGPRGGAGCGLAYVLLHKSPGSPRSWRESPAPSQSLQIAAFLFTVCHVVIVVQDWFTDLSLYSHRDPWKAQVGLGRCPLVLCRHTDTQPSAICSRHSEENPESFCVAYRVPLAAAPGTTPTVPTAFPVSLLPSPCGLIPVPRATQDLCSPRPFPRMSAPPATSFRWTPAPLTCRCRLSCDCPTVTLLDSPSLPRTV